MYRRLERVVIFFVPLHAEAIGESIWPREIFVFGPARRVRSLILGIGEEPAEGEPYFQPVGALQQAPRGPPNPPDAGPSFTTGVVPAYQEQEAPQGKGAAEAAATCSCTQLLKCLRSHRFWHTLYKELSRSTKN